MTTNQTVAPERPFDPDARTRVAEMAVHWEERFADYAEPRPACVPMSVDERDISDLREVNRQLAYAEETRHELAGDCTKYRKQRDEQHARADLLDDAFEKLAALVGLLDFDSTECVAPATQEQWVEFVRDIHDRAGKVITRVNARLHEMDAGQ